jgi:hypothetical protein
LFAGGDRLTSRRLAHFERGKDAAFSAIFPSIFSPIFPLFWAGKTGNLESPADVPESDLTRQEIL